MYSENQALGELDQFLSALQTNQKLFDDFSWLAKQLASCRPVEENNRLTLDFTSLRSAFIEHFQDRSLAEAKELVGAVLPLLTQFYDSRTLAPYEENPVSKVPHERKTIHVVPQETERRIKEASGISPLADAFIAVQKKKLDDCAKQSGALDLEVLSEKALEAVKSKLPSASKENPPRLLCAGRKFSRWTSTPGIPSCRAWQNSFRRNCAQSLHIWTSLFRSRMNYPS